MSNTDESSGLVLTSRPTHMLIVLDSVDSPKTISFRGTTELSGERALIATNELSEIARFLLDPRNGLDASNMSWSDIKRNVEFHGSIYRIPTHTILMIDETSLRRDESLVAKLELDSKIVLPKLKEVSMSYHRELWEGVAKLAQADQPCTWS